MTVKEAAARLGISSAAVRALIRAGELPRYRPTLNKRKLVLDPADVEAHCKASRREGSAEPDFVPRHVVLDCEHPFARRREQPPPGPTSAEGLAGRGDWTGPGMIQSDETVATKLALVSHSAAA
jgi:excisionase family DNA binding protein